MLFGKYACPARNLRHLFRPLPVSNQTCPSLQARAGYKKRISLVIIDRQLTSLGLIGNNLLRSPTASFAKHPCGTRLGRPRGRGLGANFDKVYLCYLSTTHLLSLISSSVGELVGVADGARLAADGHDHIHCCIASPSRAGAQHALDRVLPFLVRDLQSRAEADDLVRAQPQVGTQQAASVYIERVRRTRYLIGFQSGRSAGARRFHPALRRATLILCQQYF